MRFTHYRLLRYLHTASLLLAFVFAGAQNVNSGLVGYYTFCDGTAQDLSGNNRDGQVIGNPTSIRGMRDYGLLFNQQPGGNNGCGQQGGEYVSLPASGAIWAQGFTICAWVRFDEQKNYERIFDMSNGSGEAGGQPVWFGREGNSNNLTLESWTSSNANQSRSTGRLVATNAITNGQIEYYCATINGDQMRIYVNGKLVAQKTGNPIANITRNNNWIGHSSWCGADPDFKGFMDEIRLYNRALSPDEIQNLFTLTNIKDFSATCNTTRVSFTIPPVSQVDSIVWNFGDARSGGANRDTGFMPVHQFSDTGLFTVQAIAYKPCLNDTVIKQVRVGEVRNFLGPDFSLCKSSPTRITSGISGTDYLWQDGSTGNSFIVNDAGIYWLEVAAGGCTYRDSLTVTSSRVITTESVTICNGESFRGFTRSGEYADTLRSTSGCDSIRTLRLTVLPKISSLVQVSICNGGSYLGNSQAGTYIDTFKTVNGCDSVRTLQLSVVEFPRPVLVADTTICSGTALTLNPGVFDRYLWQDSSTNSQLIAQNGGTYAVTVTNVCGSASAVSRVSTDTCILYFPTGFTPNGDGRNDVFRMLNANNVQQYELRIFNRWGQIVFQTTDVRKGWDGRFNGKPVDSGVYIWNAAIRTNNRLWQPKGTVVLIR